MLAGWEHQGVELGWETEISLLAMDGTNKTSQVIEEPSDKLKLSMA